MNRLYTKFYLLAIIVLTISCTKKSNNFFSNNIKQVDVSSNTVTISPDTTFQAEWGSINMIAFNDIIIYTTSGRDSLFYVYKNNQYLGSFGIKGRGPNEFLNTLFCGQIYQIKDTVKLWLNDMMQQELKLVNLTQSLLDKKTIIEKKIPTPSFSLHSFIVADTAIISEQITPPDAVYSTTVNIKTNKKTTRPYYLPIESDPFTIYLDNTLLDPRKEKMVSAMCYIDQLNIYSLKDSTKISVTVGNPAHNTIPSLKSSWKGAPNKYYYIDIEADENYFLALYLNQTYDDAFRKPKSVELQIWDWNGNLYKNIKISEYLTRISLDRVNKKLYGFSIIGEKMYIYNMEKILI